ncbi:DUF4174 domain-containing protein [Parvularcula sp. LCG005]|uniref:DUF4174 domain-containing protein n=1 Tax=Parvularcula sp. LCG005 TaxID=3078805 RepID=UPI0029434794|nr:DUF4174 domain-containing protein [Parvularcula sp. LCG005]WOI53333.1 DUF4174 domain-containing protein [Parvularcula sp. LCG005]
MAWDGLETFEWERRLVVYGTTSDAIEPLEKLLRQDTQIHRSGFAERDIVTVMVHGTDDELTDYADPKTPHRRLTPTERSQVLDLLGTADADFVIVLIGLDGTEKGRWTDVISTEDIFELVDAMPMRQQELRRAQ